jgi:hypothetical protein
MARMRWMQDLATGRAAVQCPYCGTEVPADPRTIYRCHCRSGEARVTASPLAQDDGRRAA